jgi:hypothetical protein
VRHGNFRCSITFSRGARRSSRFLREHGMKDGRYYSCLGEVLLGGGSGIKSLEGKGSYSNRQMIAEVMSAIYTH